MNQRNIKVRSERNAKEVQSVIGRNLRKGSHTADKKWEIADWRRTTEGGEVLRFLVCIVRGEGARRLDLLGRGVMRSGRGGGGRYRWTRLGAGLSDVL